MKKIGCQIRETLKKAEYVLVLGPLPDKTILVSPLDNLMKVEEWFESDDYSGYVLELNGKGYEFVKTL